jgi:hypothetical protein
VPVTFGWHLFWQAGGVQQVLEDPFFCLLANNGHRLSLFDLLERLRRYRGIPEMLPSNALNFQTALLENKRKEQYPANHTT